MASFISILKKIGQTVMAIEPVIAPIASALVPGAGGIIAAVDGIVHTVQSGIATAEVNHPTDGAGALKSDAVVADFNSALDLTQQVLAIEGKKMVYDGAALQTAINAQVAAYNAFAALKSSFKIAPVTP